MPGMLARLALPALLTAGAAAQERAAPAPWRSERLDVTVPMRDGKELSADVFLPAEPGRYPAVLIQTPYDKRRLRRAFRREVRPETASPLARGAFSDLNVLVDREHYAYVVADWRGFHGSRAAMRGVDRRRWRRGLDGYDTVEWIAGRSWCNGKVGTWGGSALGKAQFDTAAERPPHLVCCVPLIAAMGITPAHYFEGGVPLDAHLRTLDLAGFGLRALVRRNPSPRSLVWRLAERRTYRPQVIDVPCLMISGWWDHYPDLVIRTFEDLVARGGERARAGSWLILGPWDHVSVGLAAQGDLRFEEARLASGLAARRFLDFHLRGLGDDPSGAARVRYFDSGRRVWRDATAWSALPRTKATFWLGADGTLRVEEQGPGSATGSYRYDPRDAPPTLGGRNLPPLPHGPRVVDRLLEREDVLVHRSAALARPFTLSGRAELRLVFRFDRPDGDFCPLLCDEGPDGGVVQLAEAAARMRYQNGDRLLEPGERYQAAIRFPSLCHTFEEGHRVVLLVMSGNAPRYERNPHTGDLLWDAKKARDLGVTIEYGAGSRLVLPTPRRE